MKSVETERTRGSGPGGQHRNRVETFIRAKHVPTGIVGQAGERRSQKENLKQAVWRLRLLLAVQYRRPHLEGHWEHPSAYRPSEAWTRHLKGTRVLCNERNDDFPALLAEALDVLHCFDDDLEKTAQALRITKSQVGKFLAKEPAAFVGLNERRKKRGLKPLRFL